MLARRYPAAMTTHRVLLSLLGLALYCCSLPSAVVSQPAPHDADGIFSGWSITAIAPHPTQPLVHLVDQHRYIHTINLTDGRYIRQLYDIGVGLVALDYLTTDRYSNTYCLITNLFRSTSSVLKLDEQLRPVADFRLELPYGVSLLDRPLLIDNKGQLWMVNQLPNGTHIVYGYDGNSGNQVDSWRPNLPSGLAFVVTIDAANFIYFHQIALPTNNVRHTYIYSTGGIYSAHLTTDGSGCSKVTSIAVTSKYDIALMCDGVDIRLLDSTGRRNNTFQYVADGMTLTSLAIDYRDTILTVSPTNGGAVIAVSADGSGAKHLWRPEQSSFVDAVHMSYDPFTDTLLTWHSSYSGIARPVLRVDTVTGQLVDVLTLPDRLTVPVGRYNYSNCFVRSASVGSRTGLLYRLLSCAAPTAHLRLFVSTAAGQLSRELMLMDWTNRFTAPLPMAVDEELDVALVALYGLTSRFPFLFAFSLSNGSELYNVSLGYAGIVTDMTRSVNHTALLTLPNRILVLGMADGELLRPIDPPSGVRFSSVAYDGQRWYFGQSLSTPTGPQNGSVVVWDEQDQQEAAVLIVSLNHSQTWLGQPAELCSVLLTNDGRVFALDRFRLAAYWHLRRHEPAAVASTLTASASWLQHAVANELLSARQ